MLRSSLQVHCRAAALWKVKSEHGLWKQRAAQAVATTRHQITSHHHGLSIRTENSLKVRHAMTIPSLTHFLARLGCFPGGTSSPRSNERRDKTFMSATHSPLVTKTDCSSGR